MKGNQMALFDSLFRSLSSRAGMFLQIMSGSLCGWKDRIKTSLVRKKEREDASSTSTLASPSAPVFPLPCMTLSLQEKLFLSRMQRPHPFMSIWWQKGRHSSVNEGVTLARLTLLLWTETLFMELRRLQMTDTLVKNGNTGWNKR